MLFAAVVAITVLTAAHEHACAGTIEVRGVDILFAGEITQADVPRVKAAYKKSPLVFLFLDSPGGDVMAAMEIGRFVRENAIRTVVASDYGARCYSACILIVMGGVQRIAMENLGIHRPRFDESYFAGLSEPAARVEYQKLSAMVEAYLAEMGAAPSLFHQMMRVSSGRIRLLTPEEAEAFAIYGSDASYEEWLRARRAQVLGLENLERLEACEQSQEYQNWVDTAYRRGMACVEQSTGRLDRACVDGARAALPPDPCASFRKVPRP